MDHLDDDLVTDAAIFCTGVADQDRRLELAAIDRDDAQAVAFFVGADKAIGVAFDDFENASGSFAAGSATFVRDANSNDVLVGGVERF